MKTKLVYAVVSGIDDIYLAQTALSAFTARYYNPDAHIALVVDDKTNTTINGTRSLILNYVDERIVVDMPEEYNNKTRSRQLKTNLRNYIKGDYLFIDSDTLITDDLSTCDKFTFDVGAVRDFHVNLKDNILYSTIKQQIEDLGHTLSSDNQKYFNSGVFYVKDTDIAYKLYNEWNRLWKSRIQCGLYTDQQPLAVANAKCNYVITEIDGIWNCQVLVNGLPYLASSKIIHYFSSGMSNKLNSSSYIFADDTIFKNINKTGEIDYSIKKLALSGRSALYKDTNVRIVSGDAYKVLFESEVVMFVLKQYFRHPIVYRMMHNGVKLYDKIINLKGKIKM